MWITRKIYSKPEGDEGSAGGSDSQASSSPEMDSASADAASNDWADLLSTDDESIEGEFAIDEKAEINVNTQEKKAEVAEVKPAAVVPEVKAETAIEEKPAVPLVETPATDAKPFDWQVWENDSIAQLIPEYQLSPEDAQAMMTEPELVLPKLAATVQTRVIANVLAHLPQILPQMLKQIQSQTSAEDTSRNTFFGINEDLKDAKFEKSIIQAGQFYRQANPTADGATASFAVGNMVRMALGMPLKAQNAVNETVQSAVPLAKSVSKPFVPSQASAGGAAAVTTDNPFSLFAEELIAEGE